MEEETHADMGSIEIFTEQRFEDGEECMLLMGFTEDELVLLHGFTKKLVDLGELLGMSPSLELASLCSRFTEGLSQYYEEEVE